MLYYFEAANCVDGVQHESTMTNEYLMVSNLNRCVFTGDTCMVGGCGRFLEGDAAGCVYAMNVMRTLPDDTKMFPAKEWALKNLQFGIKVEPENKDIKDALLKYTEIIKEGNPAIPSLLSEEKKYNVFMRCNLEVM